MLSPVPVPVEDAVTVIVLDPVCVPDPVIVVEPDCDPVPVHVGVLVEVSLPEPVWVKVDVS